jgi:hypothetical protein
MGSPMLQAALNQGSTVARSGTAKCRGRLLRCDALSVMYAAWPAPTIGLGFVCAQTTGGVAVWMPLLLAVLWADGLQGCVIVVGC